MVHPRSAHRPRALQLGQAAAVGGVYFALAWLSIVLTRQSGEVAAIWPANAVALVCLLRVDARRWPAILAATATGNVAANLISGDHVVCSAVLTLSNHVEILICAAGLRRFAGRRLDLRRPAHLWLFVSLCGVLAPMVSATLALAVVGKPAPIRLWGGWVLADCLGLMVLAPPLLLLRPALMRLPTPARLAQNALTLAALAGVVWFVFKEARVPLVFLIPPVLVLVTFQMELMGAALGVLITAVVAVTLVGLGYGPLRVVGPDMVRQMAALQVFLLVCAATALPVGATLSERRGVKRRLGASEARYRVLADNCTDVIIRLGPDGAIAYASPSVGQYGYTPAEMLGRRTLEFVHPEDQARAAESLRGLFTGDPVDTSVRREYRVATKGGDYVWLEGNPTIVRDHTGRPVEVVTNYRDVTLRRLLEDELVDARTRAEAASEAKSEFLANMSHEIRTPLTGVVGFAELLQDTPGLPDEARLCVRRIISASQSLLAVVNDILDFSKLEAGQLELDPQAFDPAAFTRDAVEIMAAQAQEKGLTLELDLDPALPPAVLADSARLRQVLLNLVGNAVKFTQLGGVTVRVRHLDGPSPRLRFEVIDTGPGIPESRIDRLFQRFSQVDGSISRQYGGTGLGLAICRRLSDLMDGDIGVASRAGGGSTFWFEVAAPVAAAPAERPADGPALAAALDRPARILVVDDLPVNRELVRAMLTPLGHDCVEAGSGQEAIDLAAGGGFDLMLMDLQMPGMDGLTAARAIRAQGDAATPILALSANVLPQHVTACAAAGMDDHIAKPIRAAELVTKVHNWLVQGRTALAPAAERA